MTSESQLVARLLAAAIDDEFIELHSPLRRHVPIPEFPRLEEQLSTGFDALADFRYPPILVELYTHVLPPLECGLIRLVASPDRDPLRDLSELVFNAWLPDRIAGAGLVAIADDGNDGGPLCLDVRSCPADAAPIVLWDHERCRASEVLFDDSVALVRCCTYLLGGGRVSDQGPLGGNGAARSFGWRDDE